MNKPILIGMTALALALGACGKKTPPADTGRADHRSRRRRGPAPPPTIGRPGRASRRCRPTSSPRRARTRSISGPTNMRSTPRRSATLAAQARWMLANPSVRASIEGHADERGTREYNLALGERRANAAKDFLIANGVPGGAADGDQLGQGAPGRAGLGRGRLGPEPPRGDGGGSVSVNPANAEASPATRVRRLTPRSAALSSPARRAPGAAPRRFRARSSRTRCRRGTPGCGCRPTARRG